MKNIDVGQAVAIAANLGVIASIGFLALQISNTATQAGTAATQNMVMQIVAWHDQIAADEALASVYARGLEDFESLSGTEKVRFDALMMSLLQMIDTGVQARDAVFVGEPPPIKERALEGYLLRHLDRPGFRQWWSAADHRGLTVPLISLMTDLDEFRQASKSED